MYNENDYRNYELYHHGILSQKWGRLNGPPYPLGRDNHSASEKKAGYKDSIGMRKGSRNEERYARPGKKYGSGRFEKSDGTLTETGKKGYCYRSVRVERNEDNDSYIVSKKNIETKLELKRRVLRDFENQTDKQVVAAFAQAYGMTIKELESYLEKEDPEIQELVNESIDRNMEVQLSDILENMDKERQQKSSQSNNNRKESKPKYTQKEAIEKAYEDLEKKYPNFNDFSEDKQDQLFFDYLNESGLYEYI